MKVYIYTVLASLLSLTGYAQNATPAKQTLPESLQNGTMEQAADQSWFFGYYGRQNENPNGFKYEHSIEAAVSGEYSTKISASQIKNDSVYASLNQSISPAAIPVGSKLTLKAKLKTVNMQGNGMALALRGNKTENGVPKTTFFKSTQGNVPISGTSEFEEYTVTVDSYPGNADSITAFIFYLPATSGVAYIDNVSLVVEAAAPAATGKKKSK